MARSARKTNTAELELRSPPKKCFLKNCQKISNNKSFAKTFGWEFQKIRDWIFKSGGFCAAGEKKWTCFAWFWPVYKVKIAQKSRMEIFAPQAKKIEDISEIIRSWERIWRKFQIIRECLQYFGKSELKEAYLRLTHKVQSVILSMVLHGKPTENYTPTCVSW